MKVLYYNYVPLGQKGVGGGIAVYLNNLFGYLIDHPEFGIEPIYLSSGMIFERGGGMYIQRDKDWNGIENYVLVNSPIIASQIEATSSLNELINDRSIIEMFDKFLAEHAEINVVHFHSFEGITTQVLKLKEKYPKIKFIHSVHDYTVLCQNAKFWARWGENCLHSIKKGQCQKCLGYYQVIPREEVLARRYNWPEIHKYNHIWMRIFKKLKLFYCESIKTSSSFQTLREHNVAMINKYSDLELCVSNRVKQILEDAGVKSKKTITSYIGTKVAENCNYTNRTPIETPIFTILYMGYASAAKGFYFVMDAFEDMAMKYKTLCKTISLRFASKISDPSLYSRIEALKKDFHSVEVYPGYTHSDFPVIMNNVNLGIVPPLWEDNLPQVAIEMIANGIPVLTSRNGGAQELNSHPCFRFNNQADFEEKIFKMLNDRSILTSYWQYCSKLTTMENHVKQLKKLYN
jgi:glycosyltransferase involved in cell wall biosynthesis